MKKKDIWIVVSVVAVNALVVLYLWRGEGRLAVETPDTELHLTGRFADGVTLRSGTEPKAVPVRAYHPKSLRLTRELEGETWQLEGRGPWGDLSTVRTQDGQTTTVKPGPPLRIAPQVTRHPNLVATSLAIYGQAGEKYSNVVTKNGRRVPPPGIKIVDRDENVLAEGHFEYG